ncbi:MAG: transcriptional regulator [Roseovarius sp. BRH_c41]|nr:MAG: transcriptional regulator [Roseovarius sp. BRH_c41]
MGKASDKGSDVGEVTTKKPRKERKENAERRRRQLLDAARRSILTYGLARTTLATVADEAGLSQGVAVFYFKSKGGLLTETLRDLYEGYESQWMRALEGAGDAPLDRLMALLAADFSAEACGADVLPVWFAFWGELRFTGHYAEVAAEFDATRHAVLSEIWAQLLPEARSTEADQLAEWMESLTDGYWQRLHLAPDSYDRQRALAASKVCLSRLVPDLLREPPA